MTDAQERHSDRLAREAASVLADIIEVGICVVLVDGRQ